MNNSDNFSNQRDSGSVIKILFMRAPKENHDALVKIGKQTDLFYKKHGVSKSLYKMNAREDITDFVSLSKVISASDDEDVWLEILSYRDINHVQEVMKALEGDKRGNELYTEAMELITPESIVIGDFSKLEETP
jgi:large subunit ribosomal protein L17